MINFSKNPRPGGIKTRVFALLLLILSCSLIISAFRSLNREFSGLVIRKTSASGIASDQYWLMLLPMTDSQTAKSVDPLILNAMSDENYPLHRVGVSSFVYEEAQHLSVISKEKFSPMIGVNDINLIDLGVNWMLMGFGGILLSLWMYWQTLNAGNRRNEREEIDIPGLE